MSSSEYRKKTLMVRVLSVTLPDGVVTQLLPPNPRRRFLTISGTGFFRVLPQTNDFNLLSGGFYFELGAAPGFMLFSHEQHGCMIEEAWFGLSLGGASTPVIVESEMQGGEW